MHIIIIAISQSLFWRKTTNYSYIINISYTIHPTHLAKPDSRKKKLFYWQYLLVILNERFFLLFNILTYVQQNAFLLPTNTRTHLSISIYKQYIFMTKLFCETVYFLCLFCQKKLNVSVLIYNIVFLNLTPAERCHCEQTSITINTDH